MSSHSIVLLARMHVILFYFSPRVFYSSLNLWLFLTNLPSIGSFGCMMWFCLRCTQENKKDREVDQAQICLQSNLKVSSWTRFDAEKNSRDRERRKYNFSIYSFLYPLLCSIPLNTSLQAREVELEHKWKLQGDNRNITSKLQEFDIKWQQRKE